MNIGSKRTHRHTHTEVAQWDLPLCFTIQLGQSTLELFGAPYLGWQMAHTCVLFTHIWFTSHYIIHLRHFSCCFFATISEQKTNKKSLHTSPWCCTCGVNSIWIWLKIKRAFQHCTAIFSMHFMHIAFHAYYLSLKAFSAISRAALRTSSGTASFSTCET